jgi:aminoglycoside 6'-N-acetyltransferase I
MTSRADYAVRPMRPVDLAEWSRMRLAFWPDSGDDDLSAIMAQAQAPDSDIAIFVAEREGGGLCGFAEFGERPYAEGCLTTPAAYFEGWWVEPDARRAGVGAALFGAGAAWVRARGRSEIASDALIENGVSIAAHGALGFQEVDRIVCFRREL